MDLKWTALMLAMAMMVFAGCGDGGATPASNSGPPARDVAAKPGPPPPPAPSAKSTEPATSPAGQSSEVPNPAAAKENAGPPPGMERVEAKGGVGKRGHGYGTGPVATPVATYFSTRDRIQFLQVKDTLRIYKGEHEHGPRTHEEFMEKIIKAYGLPLPELPPGHKYVYDPKTEELMVERPQGGGPED